MDEKNKICLLLCIHNHQPVGNFDHVLEDACEKAYLPFLELLAQYPSVKATLHYSGYLLDWLARHRGNFIDLLQQLRKRGQIEILGGGMYEPILTLLPERDRIGQIETMNERVKELFGRKPRGMWIAERVWERELCTTLSRSRIEYVPLDDYHFLRAGLNPAELTGYFLTERNGDFVKVIPGHERLRYTLPFQAPEETFKFMKTLGEKGDPYPAAVFADDGEKFGVWPGTYDLVYKRGWLRRFFSLVCEMEEWVTTRTLGEYVDLASPRGRIYLPSVSYPEMGEWSLPAEKAKKFAALLKMKRSGEGDDAGEFLQGGYFPNFLSKYEESNQMHKRMLFVSSRVEKARKKGGQEEGDFMVDNLYRAQCNDSYWHGVFGGLYLSHLRDSVYRHLLASEEMAEKVLRGDRPWTEILRGDFNRDGKDEILMRNRQSVLIVHPGDGASVSEFSFLKRGFNVQNVLTRRREGYHDDVLAHLREVEKSGEGEGGSIHDTLNVKDSVKLDRIEFDDHILRSFRDEFYESGTVPENILRGMEKPLFTTGNWRGTPSCMMSGERGALRVFLSGEEERCPVNIEKTLILEGEREGVRMKVRIMNRSSFRFSALYGSVWYLNCLAPEAENRFFVAHPSLGRKPMLGEEGSVLNVRVFGIHDGWQNMTFVFEGKEEFDVLFTPIETVSLSETGVEKIYQGSKIILLNSLDLAGGDTANVEMAVTLTDGKRVFVKE